MEQPIHHIPHPPGCGMPPLYIIALAIFHLCGAVQECVAKCLDFPRRLLHDMRGRESELLYFQVAPFQFLGKLGQLCFRALACRDILEIGRNPLLRKVEVELAPLIQEGRYRLESQEAKEEWVK